MCGLVGIVAQGTFKLTTDDLSRFNQMLVCDSVRGADSTGVFAVNSLGNASFLKEAGNPFKLIETKDYVDWSKGLSGCRMIFGHNRKATVGKITDETAHPFQEGNIILMHNGTLTNHKDLTTQEVEVDSHAITHAFVEKGYKEALKEIQGAFTLIWYDAEDKCLRFVRNDKRPLAIVSFQDNLYFSSEAHLAQWIATRDRWYTKEKPKLIDVKPGIVYSINVDNTKEIKQEVVELYSEPKTVVTTNVVALPEKKQTGSTKHTGWKGFECASGDLICVRVLEIEEYPFKPQGGAEIVGLIKGERLFPNQPPVYVYLNEEELTEFKDTDEQYVWCKVLRIAGEGNDVWRIYCNKPKAYIPEYDVTGAEVFLEEWRLANDHKCKKCNKETYWKDINLTRFKFKSPTRHRIICKECIK